MTIPIILDCDPGHDDAVAILMAVASPAIDLRAVTCVAGNAPLANTQLNARKVLTVAGVTDVPVAAGLDRPLLRELVTAPDVHGTSGLDGTRTPEPAFALDPRHAVDLMVEMIMGSAEPIVLVPTGPLSNVAVALRREPRLKERLERIVLMGGSMGQGNVTPSAEFNIYVDPDAARIVFSSGIPITMVGLDVTHKALVGPEESAEIRGLGTAVGELVADMLDFYGQFHLRQYGQATVPLHDPCCIATLIEPGLISTRAMNVQIETAGPLTLGRTVCDVHGVTGCPVTADVGVDINRRQFLDIMMDCLQRLP